MYASLKASLPLTILVSICFCDGTDTLDEVFISCYTPGSYLLIIVVCVGVDNVHVVLNLFSHD